MDLKLGSRRPRLPPFQGNLRNRLWQTLEFASASIGNIRIRTDALRRPPDAHHGFHIARGGPDIYLVECLSDALGWETVFSIAEKIHSRNETPVTTSRARGIFPLFHLPSVDEDVERDQALAGLRQLETLVKRGVLFPSIVLDRVNRNGYPLERWEDLTQLISNFIALGSASEAAADVWRTFPQVADLHGFQDSASSDGVSGLSSIGLARFRFHRESLGEELGRLHLRDLKRALSRTFPVQDSVSLAEESRIFLDTLAGKSLSADASGMSTVEKEIVEWVRGQSLGHSQAGPGRGGDAASGLALGTWASTIDRLQMALFEQVGEAAQRIENIRQDNEALVLDSPLRDTWIARISLLLPPYTAYLPGALAGAFLGSFLGLCWATLPLQGYFTGAALGAVIGSCIAWLVRRRWAKETFTLGEFSESAFTEGFPVPRTLEYYSRRRKKVRIRPGFSIQLWGELRSQVDPAERQRLERRSMELQEQLTRARNEEAELVFLDRSINAVRERIEGWRTRLAEVEIWEPGRGFSGDIFPADGPRKIYEWLGGEEAAKAAILSILERVEPSREASPPTDLAEEVSAAWGREKADDLNLEQVLEILHDRPQDLLERLSDAAAPLWPRPGDRDELIRCFGKDFGSLANSNDLHHSLNGETIFIRVLGALRSQEVARILEGRPDETLQS